MRNKAVSGIMLAVLLIGTLAFASNVQPVEATGTVYIRADGSVDPPSAPITCHKDIYTLRGNIYDSIVIERDNIVLDGAGYTVQGLGSGTGIRLSGRSGVTIKNMEIEAFSYGVFLWESSNNIISGNSITGTGPWSSGVWLETSTTGMPAENNIVSGNSITNNYAGVYFYGWIIRDNTVSGNELTNSLYGILLFLQCYRNTICGNTIANNVEGIHLHRAWDSIIYHNNFVENTIQAYPYGASHDNIWDDDYPSGGNYWSDYVNEDLYSGPNQNEPGSDGIWDHPYIIDPDDIDRYPLAEPFTPPNPTESIHEMIETIETCGLPPGTENGLTSKLEEVLYLLDMANENGAVHKLMDFINQVEALRGKKLTNEQADYLVSEAQRIIDLI